MFGQKSVYLAFKAKEFHIRLCQALLTSGYCVGGPFVSESFSARTLEYRGSTIDALILSPEDYSNGKDPIEFCRSVKAACDRHGIKLVVLVHGNNQHKEPYVELGLDVFVAEDYTKEVCDTLVERIKQLIGGFRQETPQQRKQL
ncbi:hypothetical protein DRJ48_01170 [Candidatus Woesearchaeota archaeon]|nr:MAG: hypothetical protein DRJ48_01170 [Candidatus Woesearchaeota archaeon]